MLPQCSRRLVGRKMVEKMSNPDALIFDFDGVVVDSEPIHYMGFRKILSQVGITLTKDDYYARYLGYDDHDCFEAALRDNAVDYSQTQIAELTGAKTRIVQKVLAESVESLDGAVELIQAAAKADLPLAVCSGALRKEIELALGRIGMSKYFSQIVSAEDVRKGKPDPSGYLLALNRLVGSLGRKLWPGRCVVIEDSPAGIESAKAAGMKVLAVTTSYPADKLSNADRIVASLAGVTIGQLAELI